MSPKHNHFTRSPIASVVKSSLDDFATFKKVEVHAENSTFLENRTSVNIFCSLDSRK